MSKVCIIGEVGINHNGDIEIAQQLIDLAKLAGMDVVKFQKRTIELVYTKEELDKPRESPWGTTTREQKYGLEFDEKEYDIIDRYCKKSSMPWFASPWDLESVKFLLKYDLPYNKIPSSRLGHLELLDAVAKQGKYTFISTGMATLEEIQIAVNIFRKYGCPFELMHCNGQYPMEAKDANLLCIPMLREKFHCHVGYSGHEVGLITSVAAVAMGATSVERHITLARAMYGSDQAASIEPNGVHKLVEYIREVETTLGDGEKTITAGEIKVRQKLYRTEDVKI